MQRRGKNTQAAAFPKSALQGAGLLVAAVAASKAEKVESGDLAYGEGRWRAKVVNECLTTTVVQNLAGETHLSPAAPSFLRTDIHDWREERER